MSNNRYDFSNQQINRLSAKLLYVSIAKYGDDWESTPHTHQFTEIFYVLKGKGRFMIDNHRFNVKENDFIIVAPGVEHTEYSLNDVPLEYAVVGIEGVNFFQHNQGSSISYKVYNYPSYREEFMFYLRMIVRETKSSGVYSQEICNNLFELLIITLIRKGDFFIAPQSVQSYNKECDKIRRFIDLNYQQNISLDDLVAVSHINKYYLVHSFKKAYGITPINYLIRKRIEESNHLLASTNNSISNISRKVGFSSPTYFTQIYRKNTGITPTEYRRRTK